MIQLASSFNFYHHCSTQSFKVSTTISYDDSYYDYNVCCPGYGGTYCEGLIIEIDKCAVCVCMYSYLK